ncbi:MAG: hypothetical protein JEZ06_02975 [Anaerolineaceae bacterium]|nr:hypothetical protein [Anaerolineaceae bacterium]
MDELTLEPYAIEQNWYFPEVKYQWEDILSDYLLTIAKKSTASGMGVVGHIKALVLFSDEQYFMASVIAPHIPASTKGQFPNGCTKFLLTLNILVYGVKRNRLEEISQETAAEFSTRLNGEIISRKLSRINEGEHLKNHTKENNND